MSGRNPYHVLGLKKGATEVEIKEAYKVLAKKHHPDRNQNDPGALPRFIEIKEAYDALIDRKSSKAISAVEETAAEFTREAKRRQVPRIVLWGIAASFAIFSTSAVVWNFYLKDLDRHRGLAAISMGDPDHASVLLAPTLRAGGAEATAARTALAGAYLLRGDLPKADAALSGTDDPVLLAILGDVRIEPRELKPGAVAAAQQAAVAAWRAAWERAKTPGLDPARAAEAGARVFSGFLRIGDEAAAQRVVADAGRAFPSEPWTAWMQRFLALRAGGMERIDAHTPVERALSAAMRIAHAPSGLADAEADAELDEVLRDLDPLRAEIEAAIRAKNHSPFDFGYPYPYPEIVRPRGSDWRPTTTTEDTQNAMLLTTALAVRLRDSRTRMAAISAQLVVSDSESMRRRPVYSVFIGNAKGLLTLRATDQVDVAEGLFRVSNALLRDDSVSLAGLALVARAKERGNGPALEAERWRFAIAADPHRAEYRVALSRALRRMSKLPEAIAENRAAVKEDPAFGLGWLELGDSLLAANQTADGVRAWETAAKIPESAREANGSLGDWYYERRQYPAALAALKASTAAAQRERIRTPRVAQAWFRLACLYSLSHQQGPGIDALQHANASGMHDFAIYNREPALRWLLARVELKKVVAEGRP